MEKKKEKRKKKKKEKKGICQVGKVNAFPFIIDGSAQARATPCVAADISRINKGEIYEYKRRNSIFSLWISVTIYGQRPPMVQELEKAEEAKKNLVFIFYRQVA